jgi:hypothetical protein
MSRWRISRWAFVFVFVIALVPIAASGAPRGRPVPDRLLAHVSQGVALRYWAVNPNQAPPHAASIVQSAAAARRAGSKPAPACKPQSAFNCDDLGLPQNEESIAACTANPDLVLGGTNDYRGLLDREGNFTGWHWSTNGGKSVTNEGLLPPVTLMSIPSHEVPSGGDPVDFLYADGSSCHAFAASLAYDPNDPFTNPNGVAVYRSEPSLLSSCPGGSDPSCWPNRRLIVESDVDHFLDKEWLFVGNQNGVPYVWVTYSDFDMNPATIGEHPFEASIKAVRCTIDLVTCTGPIAISTEDEDVQFSDVTVGADGRAYITWSRIDGEIEGGPEQTFTHKIRVEGTAGTAVFGPEHVIYAEDRAIPFGGFLQANDFRVATYPKSDVVMLDKPAHPRIFVVWDACKARLLGFSCIEPEIKLSYSDNDGVTWNGPFVISDKGVNYFPSISADRTGSSNKIVVTWFTTRYDEPFQNEQDVVLMGLDGDKKTYGPGGLKRLTSPSNESEADPLLGGFFIGDYIETVLVKDRVLVHYNANYRKLQLLGPFGPPFSTAPAVNQQDNFLERSSP